MKASVAFVCQECGYESPQWLGKCPECGVWNSLREFNTNSKVKIQKSKTGRSYQEIKPKKIGEVVDTEKTRITTGFLEMDGVLGGGIVTGSVILLAGDPGIGKSTLLLQTALNIAKPSKEKKENTVLYISGEESEEQIKMRAMRIEKDANNTNFLLLSNTNIDTIVSTIEELKPALVVVDSIQTVESENLEGLAGSVGQVRYAAFSLIKAAKSLNIPIIIVGHVTKEGTVAGPMILSHMVDTVLFLEGEKFTATRILRGLKNRFGPIDEVGIFYMEEGGMKEIRNPEQLFLTQSGDPKKNVPGSVLVVTMEGTRAFLVELQALTVFSKLPIPRRVASGIDYKRLELLIAVLQKHCRLPLENMDVFVNVAGGLKLSDPAIDLGICLALFSSLRNIAVTKTVGIAEIGLQGELRTAPSLEKRIKEAQKLGFKQIISAKNYKTINEVIRSLK